MSASYAMITCSLIEVGLAVPVIISGIDGEIGGIDVVALHCSLKELRLVHRSVF